MKTYYSPSKSIPIYSLIGLISIMLTSCGSYQNSSYNDRDGVYGSGNRANSTASNQDQDNHYKNYFNSLQNNDEIFTDIDNYNTTDIDSTQTDNRAYANNNGGWGSDQSNVTVNLYDNSWGYDSWYGPGWGYGGWYGGYGLGWNIGLGWGWGGYYSGWGWGGYPYYGGGYYGGGYYGGGYYGGHHGHYAYAVGGRRNNNYAYSGNNYNGRRNYTTASRYNNGNRNTANYSNYNSGRRTSTSFSTRNSGVRNGTYSTRNNYTSRNNSYNPSRNNSTYTPARNNSTYTPSRSSSPSRSYSPSSSGGGRSSGGGGNSGGGGRSGGGGGRR